MVEKCFMTLFLLNYKENWSHLKDADDHHRGLKTAAARPHPYLHRRNLSSLFDKHFTPSFLSGYLNNLPSVNVSMQPSLHGGRSTTEQRGSSERRCSSAPGPLKLLSSLSQSSPTICSLTICQRSRKAHSDLSAPLAQLVLGQDRCLAIFFCIVDNSVLQLVLLQDSCLAFYCIPCKFFAPCIPCEKNASRDPIVLLLMALANSPL